MIYSQSPILMTVWRAEVRRTEFIEWDVPPVWARPRVAALHQPVRVRTLSSLKLHKYSNHAQLPIMSACSGCAIRNDYHVFFPHLCPLVCMYTCNIREYYGRAYITCESYDRVDAAGGRGGRGCR